MVTRPRGARNSGATVQFLAGLYGGAEGGRTPDLLIANEALSQLSYGPARYSRARLIAASAGHLGRGIEGVKDRQECDDQAIHRLLVLVASSRHILSTILKSESQS